MIKTALISVSDKIGILPFAKFLSKKGISILSTGGTAEFLRKGGVAVTEVSSLTGFPEIFDGRVKTLHPKIFGGILMRRDEKSDLKEASDNQIQTIDLVAVNLYPFAQVIAKEGVAQAQAVSNIDIGGPSLLRAAAKNFAYVTVVTEAADYVLVQAQIEAEGDTTLETRKILACKAFSHTARYDETITNWFRLAVGMPELLDFHYEKVFSLRYGENPHQKASFFRNPENHDANVTNARVLHGKELSFNNIVDANSALELVKEFATPAAAIIKHNNPCGVASCETTEAAFDLAFHVDTQSAFGSVIALNRPLPKALAEYIKKHKIFVELIIAPAFEPDALLVLKEKANIRLLETGKFTLDTEKRDVKKVAGGMLVQTANTSVVTEKDLKVVTKKIPTPEEIRSMLFANVICKHVMSNAVVFAKSSARCSWVAGIGAGQMSRVDAVWIAAHKGGEAIKDSVMASDAFFPFPDAVEQAAKAGATAIISPGGSIRDEEVIAAADKLGIAMVFTGVRMFRH